MTKEEAISEMQQGKKLTHGSFMPEEWITIMNGMIVLEDGVIVEPDEFWSYRTEKRFDDGWELWSNII